MTTLYDHLGRPVDMSALNGERVKASVASVRTPYADTVLFGLTPARMVELLTNARTGDHARYLAMAAEMEDRDPNYFSALQTRRLAVALLDRSVTPADDTPREIEIAAAFDVVLQSAEFGMMLGDALDALGKGFSVTQLIWDTSEGQWSPTQFEWLDPRWFVFDRETLRTLRLVDGTAYGAELEPFKYIIHTPKIRAGLNVAGGLARIACALHLFKSYAVRDWLAFAEVFGIPLRMGRYPGNATAEAKAELETAVRAIGSDCAATIPDTMSIEFVQAKTAGQGGGDIEFFQGLADWMDRQVNKAVLGTNSTDEQGGGSFAKAKVMNGVRTDIRNSDAYQLANVLNVYVMRPWYDLNYGPPKSRHGYPRIVFDTTEPDDLALLAQSLPVFIDRGLPVSVAAILEKFGLAAPVEGDTVLTPLVKTLPTMETPIDD